MFHVKDNLKWQQFFNEIGFDYWYSVYRFSYEGAKFDEPNIYAVKYEDKYYEDRIRLESEAFSVLRRENDIKPYNWYLSASNEKALKLYKNIEFKVVQAQDARRLIIK